MNIISLPSYKIEPITLDNLCRYEDVFYCNEEYYMITDGRPATKNDCIETIEYYIDGMPRDNFHNIGISDKGRAVGCMFVVEGYPDTDTLWLGLLLIHNQYKRKHIGAELVKALIDSLKDTTTKYIRLSVQDNNVNAVAFWKHIGFSVVETTDCGAFVNFTMEYIIC